MQIKAHVSCAYINMLMVKAYYTLITIKQLKQTSVTADNTLTEVYDKLEQTSPEANDTMLKRTSLKAKDKTKPVQQFTAASL